MASPGVGQIPAANTSTPEGVNVQALVAAFTLSVLLVPTAYSPYPSTNGGVVIVASS